MLKVKIRLKEHSLVNKIRLDLNMLEKTLEDCLDKYEEIKEQVSNLILRNEKYGKKMYENIKKFEYFVFWGESLKKMEIVMEKYWNKNDYRVEIAVHDSVNLEKEFNEAISEFKNMANCIYEEFCLTKLKVVGCGE